MKNALPTLLLLPRNAAIAILSAYRATVSPLYGDVCRYYPSCSTYTLGAIQNHGAVKGIALGAWRIARCNPWSAGGVDDVPEAHHHHHNTITTRGFVTPRLDSSQSHERAYPQCSTS